MKYCHNCGAVLEDDMLFCQACGTKASPQATPYETESNLDKKTDKVPLKPMRKKMESAAIVCAMLAILCALLSFSESSIFPVSVFFLSLALLFLVLSKFPKERPYLWGRNHGVKKSIFVCCAIMIAVGFFTLWETTLGLTPSSTGQSNTGIIGSPEANETSPQASTEPPAITLTDVQSWYEAQLPGLGQSLMTSLPSVSGLSNVNITDSKFRFGEDSGWYDCHYTFYFDCQVSGASCSGEARAFLKYSDNAPAWFHIEIVRDSDWATIVEHYDESYDQIIESYYKELVTQYGG